MVELRRVQRQQSKRGLLTFEAEITSQIEAYFSSHLGAWYDVDVRLHRKDRTLKQNAHIHGDAQQIARSTDTSIDTVKDAAKQLAVGRGYPTERRWDGVIVPKSSSLVKTVHDSLLISCLHQIADEQGIPLKCGKEWILE